MRYYIVRTTDGGSAIVAETWGPAAITPGWSDPHDEAEAIAHRGDLILGPDALLAMPHGPELLGAWRAGDDRIADAHNLAEWEASRREALQERGRRLGDDDALRLLDADPWEQHRYLSRVGD